MQYSHCTEFDKPMIDFDTLSFQVNDRMYVPWTVVTSDTPTPAIDSNTHVHIWRRNPTSAKCLGVRNATLIPALCANTSSPMDTMPIVKRLRLHRLKSYRLLYHHQVCLLSYQCHHQPPSERPVRLCCR